MSTSFNVLDQGWIPVVCRDGTRKLLGIRQVLSQAHELREISDASPLEEYSLYRFLGLFLMDAMRPKKRSNIRAILRSGAFDMEQIEQYIELCRTEGVSFDLFDEERPFLQSRYEAATDGPMKAVSALDCTRPSGNNHTHFIHNSPEKMEAQRAARLLLTTYWFCTAGAQGYPSGVYGAPPFFGVIKGDSLFDTLAALLIPLDIIRIPFDSFPVFWRRTAPVRPKAEIGSTSWLQGVLFPTRRIHLVPDESGAVVGVHLSQGENYVNKEAWRDPYVTYRSNDTSVFPLRPHTENPIWRNYCDIIDINGNHASQMLRLFRSIHDEQDIRLTLYGVETSQASYLSVHRHDLSLPIRLAEEDSVELLKSCIAASQQLNRSLEKNLGGIASLPTATVSTLSKQFDQVCEERFWQLCDDLNAGRRSPQQLYDQYCVDVSKDVLQTFDAVMSSLKLRAHALAVVEEKRKWLLIETRKLTREEKTT